MKILLIAFASMISLSAFAQDKVDLVLYRLHSTGGWGNQVREFSLAKVEMTRERYDRMFAENLMMYCRTTKDKDVDLVFYQGQITVHHKKNEHGDVVGRCEAIGCKTETFEDLSKDNNGASNGVFTESTPETKDYMMGSEGFYEELKRGRPSWNLPEVSDIPYVTIYDPAIHGTKFPLKNSFGCAIQNAKTGEHVSP